ncbi:3 beta-hydroxysteroid dehydrogenase/Delta 5--_4-isomerase [Stieleria maiorica]|uniref:3 beta-hydroxysteroid dehydrogenase/Delta 5-->4-isomerase n=1 Tax=Stieleria maiorica TaxID=2795974 RepID=A0A5B9MEK1_9BACT|nr:NAD(P)-dependent oxidoreductase [Stieleria maiorica]QEF97617.1 3 beta-hydroxysteroid dehydrogenase/Delta 5-->4-isomerase [Stieleria maiorica]
MSTPRPVVIVTGSSGLLGRPVCNELADRGYEVFGFDRVGLPEPPKNRAHVHDVECDITRYDNVRGAVAEVRRRAGEKLASVVHLAAYYDFSGEDSDAYDEVTVNGTDRLLNALSEFDLGQFIFASTMLVHQPCEPGRHISEDDPLLAKWPYPKSKIETERLIREGHPDVRSVFLRIAGVYTDNGRQPTIVQQIKRIYEKDLQSHFFPGDTSTGQSAVHLDDAVSAIVATVQHRERINAKTAILIGEPDPPSYETLQEAIGQRIHGKDWTTLCVPKPLAKVGAAVTNTLSSGEAFIKPFMVPMADDHYALDISRAKALIDWEPKYRLIDQLPIIIDRLKQNPDQWYRNNGLQGEM